MMYPDDTDNGHDAVHDHEESNDETNEVHSIDATLGLSLRSRHSIDPSIPSAQNVTSCNQNVPTQPSPPRHSSRKEVWYGSSTPPSSSNSFTPTQTQTSTRILAEPQIS